ncbi:MAG: thiolase family protein [Deltaproteobacteria bacterium]|nr:thiolase family protein [Deltaproteobacteria bacterium]
MQGGVSVTRSVRDAVIVSAARTPVGVFGGTLKGIHSARLGALAVEAAVQRAGVDKDLVDEVIMGCVLPAGLGQAPARQAAIYAGLPNKVECLTVNKVCGSGLKSVMLAAQSVMLGDADVVVAGGMESMSGTPYYLKDSRWGMRMNNKSVIDGMVFDGLWDPYNDFHMGIAAEMCAEKYGWSRQMQDEFAAESTMRAKAARDNGWFDEEIIPVEVPQRKGDPIVMKHDEGIERSKPEKMPKLRPAFKPDGTVTAANASSLNDGAAATLVMSAEQAKEMGLKPLARIVDYCSAAQASEWFTTAPIAASKKLLKKTGLSVSDIDLWEVNEAFAVVNLSFEKEMEVPRDRINIHGGAVVLGHPIGASGARILTTLLFAMKRVGAKKGVATLCIGGGEAAAMLVEAL